MPRRSAVSLARTTILAVLMACLVLGVSSSRIAGGGLAKQEAASVADPFIITKMFRRSLQWWKVDDKDDEDDKRKNDDDDDDRVKDDDDDDDKCAERDDRSQECGASDSFPKKCCGSLVCDGNRCRREDDVEEDDDDDDEKEEVCADPGERSQACGGGSSTPESCCGDSICNMETKRCEEQVCSLLGRRSQQCGGGGALPVTCCGNLVCNENNRCDDPANAAGNAQDDSPTTDDGGKDVGVPDTPDTQLSPAPTPATFEPTLDPTMEPTKEAGGFVAISGATSRAAVAAWVSICAGILHALF